MGSERFAVTVVAAGRDSLLVPVPFNPNVVWGSKPRHHIAGTVNGVRVRAVIEPSGEGFGFTLGPKSPSRAGLAVGDEVTVDIAPEGPQRDDLAEDIAEAWLPTQRRGRSSTRSHSSTAGPTCAGSTRPNADPNNARYESPRW
jgi:hypothetical protein